MSVVCGAKLSLNPRVRGKDGFASNERHVSRRGRRGRCPEQVVR